MNKTKKIVMMVTALTMCASTAMAFSACGHEHKLSWKETTPATCTDGGVWTGTCADGDYTETHDGTALGHKYGDWAITAPTQTTAGSAVKTCGRANHEALTVELPALGTAPAGTYTVQDETEATYAVNGVKKYTMTHAEGDIVFRVTTPKKAVVTVSEAVTAAAANKASVRNGTIKSSMSVPGYSDTDVINYEYGKDYASYSYPTGSASDSYYFKDGETFYGFENQSGYGLVKLDQPNEKKLQGYEFYLAKLVEGETYYYGTEAVLGALYEMAEATTFKAQVWSTVEDGTYKFKFGLKFDEEPAAAAAEGDTASEAQQVSYTYVDVAVKFTLLDNALYTLDFEYVGYDDKYCTIEGTTVTLAEDAEEDFRYDYSVVQEFAEVRNPLDIDSMYATAITVKNASDEEVQEGGKVTTETGSAAVTLGFAPESYVPSMDELSISWLDEEGAGLVEILNKYDTKIKAYMWGNTVTFYCNEEGDYTVVLKTRDVEKTFTVSYVKPAPTGIEVQKQGATVETGVEMYAGGKLVLNAQFTPTDASQLCVAEITSANAADATLTKVGSNYEFTTSTAGEYTVTFKSAVDENVTKSITVTAVTPPTAEEMATVMAGTYNGKTQFDSEVSIVFSEEADKKYVELTVKYDMKTVTEKCEYTYANGVITLTHPTPDAAADPDAPKVELNSLTFEKDSAGEYSFSATYTRTDAVAQTAKLEKAVDPALYELIKGDWLYTVGDTDYVLKFGANQQGVCNGVSFDYRIKPSDTATYAVKVKFLEASDAFMSKVNSGNHAFTMTVASGKLESFKVDETALEAYVDPLPKIFNGAWQYTDSTGATVVLDINDVGAFQYNSNLYKILGAKKDSTYTGEGTKHLLTVGYFDMDAVGMFAKDDALSANSYVILGTDDSVQFFFAGYQAQEKVDPAKLLQGKMFSNNELRKSYSFEDNEGTPGCTSDYVTWYEYEVREDTDYTGAGNKYIVDLYQGVAAVEDIAMYFVVDGEDITLYVNGAAYVYMP